ncbi:uncharacterized protein FIBRA_02899 [Fibroporia radiculosa]|uniref:Uncharacterized protein n=1 Tax=Fibroporia radiculosa TaxID=599839 RepID=J4H239_9APHY|nr:uncharacterized protein FIBRA_02899 [Fibroporia radiculosa]CCM00854.1 predicted protein [Fibroporia radiculosa]
MPPIPPLPPTGSHPHACACLLLPSARRTRPGARAVPLSSRSRAHARPQAQQLAFTPHDERGPPRNRRARGAQPAASVSARGKEKDDPVSMSMSMSMTDRAPPANVPGPGAPDAADRLRARPTPSPHARQARALAPTAASGEKKTSVGHTRHRWGGGGITARRADGTTSYLFMGGLKREALREMDGHTTDRNTDDRRATGMHDDDDARHMYTGTAAGTAWRRGRGITAIREEEEGRDSTDCKIRERRKHTR